MFILNAAYSQSPTMLSKSKNEEKVLEDINSDSWILPQYFTKENKEEIAEYILPKNAIFGNTIENSDAPPLIEIVKDKRNDNGTKRVIILVMFKIEYLK